MRALLRAVLLIAVVAIIAVVGYGWWTGTTMRSTAQPDERPTATSGTVDVSKARERGAEVGEKAAEAVATIQESVADAGVTSKIKAKMALDDYVQARRIDVSTNGSTVTLSGTVRSNVEHDRAVKLARETAGVERVVDRIDVRP